MRRFFASSFVSFALLACASCGGAIEPDPSQKTGTAPTPTSTATSGPPKRPPGSSSSSSGSFPDPDACPQDFPLTAAELDEEIGWKNGAAAAGSCSDADLERLEQNFADVSVRTYLDLGKGLSTACRACVLSRDTDATWGPIVATAGDGGETGFVNYGACFGVVDGPACGKAVQYEHFCDDIACNECTFTASDRQKCVSAATSGMCSSFHTATIGECANLATSAGACADILEAAKTLCGQ